MELESLLVSRAIGTTTKTKGHVSIYGVSTVRRSVARALIAEEVGRAAAATHPVVDKQPRAVVPDSARFLQNAASCSYPMPGLARLEFGLSSRPCGRHFGISLAEGSRSWTVHTGGRVASIASATCPAEQIHRRRGADTGRSIYRLKSTTKTLGLVSRIGA